jgi:hypothetical protein
MIPRTIAAGSLARRGARSLRAAGIVVNATEETAIRDWKAG